MISWSTRRQLTYLSFPLLGLLLIVYWGYMQYVYQAPTCFDGLKNGTEQGVDCGGSCTLVCTSDSLTPIVLWSKSFKVTSTVVNATAYIQNPNVHGEVRSASYVFKLYDQDHNLIASREGTTHIPKNTTFAVFEGGIQVKDKIVKQTEFEFTAPLVWQKTDTQEPDFNVEYSDLKNQTTAPIIEGTITPQNVLSNKLTTELIAIIYDGRKNAIGTSRTVVDIDPQNPRTDFVFTWPQPFETGVDVCEVPTRIMLVLDRSGSMQSISTNPPEPLSTVKQTARAFVDSLQKGDMVGVVSFATQASSPVDSSPTTDFVQAKNAIDSIVIATSSVQNTNIGDGLYKAIEQLSPLITTDSRPAIILLTDGDPTDPKLKGQVEYPVQYATAAAQKAKDMGIELYTIGLGKDVKADFLGGIASTPAQYFSAPTTATLSSIYKKIGTSLCKRKPNVIEIIPRVLTE